MIFCLFRISRFDYPPKPLGKSIHRAVRIVGLNVGGLAGVVGMRLLLFHLGDTSAPVSAV